MRKKALMVLVGFAGVVVVLIGLLITGNKGSGGFVPSTTFLGYTNNPTEGRLALFRFSNSTPALIQRWYFCEIQFQTATGWTSQGTRSFPRSNIQTVLHPGESEIVPINPPTTQYGWRLGFPYMQDANSVRRLAGGALLKLQALGLPTKYDRSKAWSYSDDITP